MNKRDRYATGPSPTERTLDHAEVQFRRGHPYNGLFIHLDGPDGCGKTSQIKLLEKHFAEQGYNVTRAQDPGGTDVGSRIRQILLHMDDLNIHPRVEMFLFGASRAQLVDEIIRPNLKEGGIVITDRYESSTTAYQGAAGKVTPDLIATTNRIATDGVLPDRSYFFDVPYEIGVQRRGKERADRIEKKREYFHQRVREGFLGQSLLDPERIRVIDATQSVDKVHHQVIEDVERYIDHFKLRDKLIKNKKLK